MERFKEFTEGESLAISIWDIKPSKEAERDAKKVVVDMKKDPKLSLPRAIEKYANTSITGHKGVSKRKIDIARALVKMNHITKKQAVDLKVGLVETK